MGSTDEVTKLLDQFTKLGGGHEFEISYVADQSRPITYDAVEALKAAFAAQKNVWKEKEAISNTINIIHESQRFTYDSSDIKAVDAKIKTLGNMTMSEAVEKKRVGRVDIGPMRVSLRVEAPIDKKLPNSFKKNVTVRHKKRRSFVYAKDASIQLDLTAVKQTKPMQYNQFSLGMLYGKDVSGNVSAKYEIELEYTGDQGGPEKARELVDIFQNHVRAHVDPTYIVPELQELHDEYAEMVGAPGAFIGPKPVTLDRIVLREMMHGNFGRYTVTDKADGERVMVFISKSGDVYTINDRMKMKAVPGLKSKKARSCIMDGEMLSEEHNKILLFDVYFVDGKDVRNHPLLSNRSYGSSGSSSSSSGSSKSQKTDIEPRLALAADVINGLEKKDAKVVDVQMKHFVGFDDKGGMAAACKQILSQDHSYHTDGLIFTPNNVQPPLKGGTWTDTFKWKPPDENSIDFKVVFHNDVKPNAVGSSSSSSSSACMSADLMVEADAFEAGGPITSLRYLSGKAADSWRSANGSIKTYDGRILQAKRSIVNYKYGELHLDCVPKKSNAVKYDLRVGKVGDLQIKNGDIVECSYVKEGRSWMPMRIRADKTKPNFLFTAQNVTATIENEITEKMLLGGDPVPGAESDGEYYTHSDRRLMEDLRNAHNGIKSALYDKVPFNSVIDFGIGRGGDLMKVQKRAQEQGGRIRVFGIDPSLTNLSSPSSKINSAYLRLIQEKNQQTSYPDLDCVLLPMDASTDIANINVINLISNEEDRAVAKMVFGEKINETEQAMLKTGIIGSSSSSSSSSSRNGRNGSGSSGSGTVLSKYSQFAATTKAKFDLASCMFAVHYMFATKDTLGRFAANVNKFLHPDKGLFVGACLDGGLVRELLQDTDKVERRDDTGRVMWSIKRAYDSGSGSIGVGNAVDVFVATIGQTFREYLVDYKVLVDAMSKSGGMRGNVTGVFGDLIKNKNMSDSEAEYSRLHRWFIFSRTKETVPEGLSDSVADGVP